MKITYLILCHKDPGQVARLIARLDQPDVSFVIHVDKRAKPNVSHDVISAVGHLSNIAFAKEGIVAIGEVFWNYQSNTLGDKRGCKKTF